ncbi:AraC family transcriptional regulator [Nitriliruptoraceae bacterium ZYF776]|nr:AraC family transcriptional regulator [Profundirhabdus halotolerans]
MDAWNRALTHVEDHLDGSFDVADLARITATSVHHVHRVFSALTGIGLREYVRRRTLTVAAAEVVAGERSLLEVAIDHGYGSTEAFARAFRRFHGVGPSEARAGTAALRSQPRLRLHLDVTGADPVEHRITTTDPMTLVGLSTRVPVVHLGENAAMEAFHATFDEATTAQLAALSDREPTGILGVVEAVDDATTFDEGEEVVYWHAVVTDAAVPEGFASRPIPGTTWVVLATEGRFPEAMQQLWADAASVWFPANPGWRWAPGPQLLGVDEASYDADAGTAAAELWLPIEPNP